MTPQPDPERVAPAPEGQECGHTFRKKFAEGLFCRDCDAPMDRRAKEYASRWLAQRTQEPKTKPCGLPIAVTIGGAELEAARLLNDQNNELRAELAALRASVSPDAASLREAFDAGRSAALLENGWDFTRAAGRPLSQDVDAYAAWLAQRAKEPTP